MLISRTAQYAIQTLVYLSLQDKHILVGNDEISKSLNIPSPYLSQLMQKLRKEGLLVATRGRLGGYRLKDHAADTNLLQIIHMIDGTDFINDCALGLKACDDIEGCPFHNSRDWLPLKKKIAAMFAELKFSVLAEEVRSGQYQISDIPCLLKTN